MSRSTIEKFVDRVHRRLVIFRTLEQLGLGMLLASLLATVLNLLAIWQSMATMPILIFSAGLGLLIGLALAIYRWPTRTSAVIQADRQLRFDDLLTSALFPSGNTDDFTSVVRAMADAKCRQHSPNEVFVRRLSARTWSAIGLAMGIAVTLGVIPFGAVRSQAIDVNSAVLSRNPAATAETVVGKKFQNMNDPSSEGSWNDSVSSEQKADGNLEPSQSKHSGDAGSASGSGGSSTTAERSSNQKLQNDDVIGTKNATGKSAGGGASSGDSAQRGEESNGRQGAATHSPNFKSGWNGDAVSDGSANSINPSNDRIPPEDRDLIRDFFDGR
jgi:hypothetical protein